MDHLLRSTPRSRGRIQPTFSRGTTTAASISNASNEEDLIAGSVDRQSRGLDSSTGDPPGELAQWIATFVLEGPGVLPSSAQRILAAGSKRLLTLRRSA